MKETFQLILTEDLEAQRTQLVNKLHYAQANIRRFAVQHGWEAHADAGLVDTIELFGTKSAFDSRILQASGAPSDSQLPATYVAVIDKRTLYACSEAVARRADPRIDSSSKYHKILVHELAHALHIAVLHGQEEEMGPRWFYEGFAIVAAEQYLDTESINEQACLDIIHDRGKPDYSLYGWIVRQLAKKRALEDLVQRAGKGDFPKWAVSQLE